MGVHMHKRLKVSQGSGPGAIAGGGVRCLHSHILLVRKMYVFVSFAYK